MEDEKIIELFFERDEHAIKELDTKYGSFFYKIAYNILNSTSDAEECVNDAYLGTWNAIPPNRPNPLIAFVSKFNCFCHKHTPILNIFPQSIIYC